MTPHYLLKPARLAGSSLLATQSDDRLVDLVRAGSEPAFDAIVSRYRGPLLRYCGALLGAERAEDAVQQALVNAYKAMQRDDKKLILKPWLYRIAHNSSLNALRDGGPKHEALEDEHATVEQPHEVHERRERLAEVLAAVQTLPVRQRDAIVLREVEGRSYEEIAAALGTGAGSVRALINRARGSLRMAMTAVTPIGLLLRLPSAADVTAGAAGAGAGAIATKVAATALVTGAVAGGVALVPIDDGGSKAGRPDAAATIAESAGGGAAAQSPQGAGAGGAATTSEPGDDHGGRGETRHRHRHRGRGEDEDHSGSDDRGADDGGRGPSSNSGPGGGGDDGDRSTSGSGSSGPGRGDDALEGSRSGPGGGGAETEVESGSGSSGPGSGSTAPSGSGSGGSGSSGSGSGGSGGSGSSGSGSGGSSGSGSGGSGSGGSDDSGSHGD
jgi:RNA polymerase sigma factor (sigma-70 family)